NTAQGDAADQGGGGVFNTDGSVILQNQAKILTNLANGVEGSGGGILTLGGTLSGSTFNIDFNAANRAGGGIEMAGGSANFGSNTRIRDNKLNGVAGTPNPGNGGGV